MKTLLARYERLDVAVITPDAHGTVHDNWRRMDWPAGAKVSERLSEICVEPVDVPVGTADVHYCVGDGR